jgi:hypothetical protein
MRIGIPWLALASCVLVAPALADERVDFSQYRIPEHSTRRFTFNVQAGAGSDGNELPGNASAARMGSATLQSFASWMHDADTRQWQLAADASLGGSRRSNELSAGPPWTVSPFAGATRASDVSESLHLGAGLRQYPWAAPWGIEAMLDARVDDRQAWDRTRLDRSYPDPAAVFTHTRELDDTSDWTYAEQVGGQVRLGWGRVRDASTVYTVWLIERRWLRDGTLARALSAGARDRLAGLFSLRGGFKAAHDRPEKAFWKDVERIVAEDGALRGNALDAGATLHALEPLMGASGTGDPRLAGAFVGPTFGYAHQHTLDRRDVASTRIVDFPDGTRSLNTSTLGYRDAGSTSMPVVGARAELHRPLGIRTQLDASIAATADARGLRRFTETRSNAQATYRIDERWKLTARGAQDRTLARGANGVDAWALDVRGELRYEIEDHWSAGLSGDLTRAHTHGDGRSNRRADVRFSVGYNRGALDAPGLIEPVRPLP